jgi:type IV pilus assembly protein PilA
MGRRQKGFSLIELLIVVMIILIIAAIAVPNLLRSRMAANEASAVASLRSIHTSQVVYQSTYGPGFATKLADLSDGGTAANCAPTSTPTSTAACLIDAALAGGTKSGYTLLYTPVTVGTIINSYSVNADPTTSGTSGQRHFFTDYTNLIRVNPAAVATNSDPAI